MSNPFETLHPNEQFAGSPRPLPITPQQRRTLRTMGREKAELIGKSLQQADAALDSWLAEMTKETATSAIHKLAQWLDDERARRGIPKNVWRSGS